MKTLFQTVLLFSLLFNFSTHIMAQGLIVNEGGNGQGGNKDFFELLVIGSTTQPTGTVNLTGWIIDDNNGQFGSGGTGKGIAQGHIRLKSTCFSNVPIGSIIIIYNAGDKETLMPADDPTDANGDLVYILPSSHSCIEKCGTTPTSSNVNYNSSSCSYASFTASQWSSVMGLSGDQDAFQTRKPDGTFFHGFGYGFTTTQLSVAPNFPAELGGGKSFNFKGGAARYSLNYNCGPLNDINSYSKDTATINTPGAPNNAQNALLIEKIRLGQFDYSDWGNPANCEDIVLPLQLLTFEVEKQANMQNLLVWELMKVDPNSTVYIERSENGFEFETIATLPLEATMEYKQYSYQDQTPFYTTYYRLRFEEPLALDFYSPIRVVNHSNAFGEQAVALYPNPASTVLNITFSEIIAEDINYQIVDGLGRVVAQGVLSSGNMNAQLSTDFLASGTYYLRLDNAINMHLIKQFIKL